MAHPSPAPDRDTAARINPIISIIGRADTISECAALVDLLGQVAACAEHVEDTRALHRLTGAVSAALRFEVEACHA